MALEQKLSLKLSQRLVMTPSLQQAIKLLQMTRLELEAVVAQELEINPVLEEAERGRGRGGGRLADRGLARRGPRRAPDTRGDRAPAPRAGGFRGLPRRRFRGRRRQLRRVRESRGAAAREHPDARARPLRPPALADPPLGLPAARARDRRAHRRQPEPGRIPGRARSRRSATWRAPGASSPSTMERGARRARAVRRLDPPGIACANLRESLLLQLDLRGEPADSLDPPGARRPLGSLPAPPVRDDRARPRRLAGRARAGDRGDQDPPDPAGAQVHQRPHALHRARRLRHQGGRRVRHPAQRRRPAAAADLAVLPQDAEEPAPGGPPERRAAVHLREDALGALDDQEPRPAPADDLQGRRPRSSASSATSSTTASTTSGRWCCATSPTTSACTSRR